MTISLNSNLRSAEKDEILFREGETPSKIYIVEDGVVLCLKRSKDRLIPVLQATAKQIVGEEAVLSREPYTYSAVVLAPSTLLEIDAALVGETMAKAPYWLNALMATLGERFHDTTEAIAEHRLMASELGGMAEFTPQEENRYKKLLS